MRVIPTRAHGWIDYLMGILLVCAPWVLGFARNGAETWVPVIIGASVIVYSLCTNYELGIVKAIPMRSHLTLDFLGGGLLAASPWLFGFSEYIFLPHLLVGVTEIIVALITETVPGSEHARTTDPRRQPVH